MYKSSTQSLQNALLLLLFVIGLFILYRYVKTLEGEVKMIQNHVIELGEQMRVISENSVGQNTCPMPSPSSKKSKRHAVVQEVDSNEFFDVEQHQSGGEPGEEENESVKSEDITNILRQVINNSIIDDETDGDFVASAQNMFSAVFTTATEEPKMDLDAPTCVVTEIEESKANDIIESAKEDAAATTTTQQTPRTINIDDNDEDIETTTSHKDDLFKKTNEELRTILKNNQLSVKGAKSELVERIMENNIF